MIQVVLEIFIPQVKAFYQYCSNKNYAMTCCSCVSITNTQKLDHYYVDKCTPFFYFLLCCFYKPEYLLTDISKYEESNVCFLSIDVYLRRNSNFYVIFC